MKFLITALFPFLVGLYCFFFPKNLLLGIIGLILCWTISGIDIYLGIKEIRNNSK